MGLDLIELDMICAHIVNERRRQEALKAQGKFKYTCADPELSDAQCYAVLGEEFGEVGHEVNEIFNMVNTGKWFGGDSPGELERLAALRKELVEVAAVAVAWIERLDTRAPVSLSGDGLGVARAAWNPV